MRPPESWRSAIATLTIAAVTAIAWLVVSAMGRLDYVAVWAGFIPERVYGVAGDEVLVPLWLTPLTATLVHAGFLHLILNLVVLLFCGRAIEPIIGWIGLILLYVLGAYASAAGQFFFHDIVGAYAASTQFFFHVDHDAPMVGASGAISAVLGAYAILFGRNRVKIANQRLAVWLHALWVGAAWVALQLLMGFTFETLGTRLAVGAHIGGFLVGMLLARPLLLLRYRKA